MKKVMILLCVLTVGVIFATENEKTEAKEKQLTELSALLQPTKINKAVDFGTTVCSGGTGTQTWRVWKDSSGNYWVTPSLEVQNTGQGTWRTSEQGAELLCKLAKGNE